jgi:drug/metabolite transporter (DMT)-like permease
MKPSLALLLLSVSLASAGQVLLKVGASRAEALVDFINPSVIGGLVCYAAGTVIWVWVLSREPLSTAYAFTALTLVLVYLASWLLLGERITAQTAIGLAFILVGVIVVSIAARG